MDILEKGRELADALEKSTELKAVRDAEAALQADKSAAELWNNFQSKQIQIYKMQMAGETPSDNLSEELNNLRVKIQANEVIMVYLEAQEKLGKILDQVNYLISKTLQGDSCESEGCAGCSGCS